MLSAAICPVLPRSGSESMCTDGRGGRNAANALDLPVNRRVDDRDVAVDFRAVFKGVNVGGIDGQDVSQVARPESVTHCEQSSRERVLKLSTEPN